MLILLRFAHSGENMVRVKSVEEAVENYVIGVIQGAFKTKRYWMKQGYDEEHAIKNAVNYAIGQIKAGISMDRKEIEATISKFREMAEIANALADSLNIALNNLPAT
jgi:hypothetical protein